MIDRSGLRIPRPCTWSSATVSSTMRRPRKRFARADKEWRAPAAPSIQLPGKALQLEFTVEDTGVFTMPWSATLRRRDQILIGETCPGEMCQHDYLGRYYSDQELRLVR